MSALLALSPLDGRYADSVAALRPHLSEFGLIHNRVRVELAWLQALADCPQLSELPAADDAARDWLAALGEHFDIAAAERVKQIEATTRHDVKAVEYWLKERLAEHPFWSTHAEFVHFACTSEDINNLAYALMLQQARAEVLLPTLDALIEMLRTQAHALADLPMLSRTHGQAASPTTLGKELANVVARLRRARQGLAEVRIDGKLNGAVGNYNAHLAAAPEIDWESLAAGVIRSLGLQFNAWTTQIEPHDWIAELCDAQRRIDVILIDFCRDVWGYISLGYFRQATVAGEVGSSTMPHKVNPIDFENAEGNFGLADALLGHLAQKLPVSRWQRDLTDSTVLRNLGVAFGHALLGMHSLRRGLGKLSADPARLAADLEQNWEVLGEAIQTVMRRHGLPEPYERLKALTRGQRIDAERLRAFVDGLELPADVRERLRSMTPADYTGLAATLARRI
ncbi:MAG: adenylosuccinate lyase [Xanthomonadales bacterium]|nr:adenylosuccinate lyase [Xanthomonadales bacterium]MCB1626663.1 adenylosuccinate lyase [Xanthomonadales bacterium]